MRAEIIRIDNATCQKAGVAHLQHFNLQVYSGEIMGLLTVNSHGVGVLLSLLQNNLPLHFGRVYFQEELVNSHIYRKSGSNRVAVIERRSHLIEGLNVAESVFVFSESGRNPVVNARKNRERLRILEQNAGIAIPYNSLTEHLSIFERCAVELMKAVVAQIPLIVIRDVCHYMSSDELQTFQRLLRHYAALGTTFLCISNHYEDLSGVVSRTAVMHDGKIVKVVQQMKPDEMSRLIQCVADVVSDKDYTVKGSAKVCFSMQNVRIRGRLLPNLDVLEGECLAIHDEDNLFFQSFKELVTRQLALPSGKVYIDGKPACGPLTHNRKFAYIAEDPASSMLFPDMDYLHNLSLGIRSSPWRRGAIHRSLRQELRSDLGDVFDKEISRLSLKEQYSLIFYRVLLQHPRVVFCEHPFWGGDVDLRQHIIRLVNKLLARGIAVVIVTAGRYEIFPRADRVVTYRKETIGKAE